MSKRTGKNESMTRSKRSKYFAKPAVSTTIVRDIESLSSFEKLPKELVWKIIGEAPEAVLNLRLTSHVFKSHVDSYAVQKSITPLIEHLKIAVFIAGMNKLHLTMHIYQHKLKLFALRQTLLWFTPMPKFAYIGAEEYEFQLSGILENDVEDVDFLRENISAILTGVHCPTLRMTSNTLDNGLGELLFHFITNVQHVVLDVVNVTTSDPKSLLLELSSSLQFITINQAGGHGIYGSYFFGLKNADWSSIIIEMYSRRLDTLYMSSYAYSTLLTPRDVDELRKRLPMLSKKIWFEGYSIKYRDGLEYILNDHSVYVDPNGVKGPGRMVIKHLSRYDED